MKEITGPPVSAPVAVPTLKDVHKAIREQQDDEDQ
jgi:hypothetical protein